MSFASAVKEELCRNAMTRHCCAAAEAYGMLIYAASFSTSGMRLSTSCAPLAKRIPQLFTRVFGFAPDMRESEGGRYVFYIDDQERMKRIFAEYGYEFRVAPLHVNFSVLEEPCCRTAFLRGAFLAGGSVINPEKKYHLELSSHHMNVAREVVSLLLEMEFLPGLLHRRYDYVIYLKDSGAIEDFLTTTGAPMSAMEIMQIKVEKELRNDTNRRINCDEGNISKSVAAAGKQLDAIRVLDESGVMETLPVKLRETAELRRANPELTLAELAAISDPPLSKPGLSHRLSRIVAIAEEVRNG